MNLDFIKRPAIIFHVVCMAIACAVTRTKYSSATEDEDAIKYSYSPEYKIQKIVIGLFMLLAPIVVIALAYAISTPLFIITLAYAVLNHDIVVPQENYFDMYEFSQDSLDELFEQHLSELE